MGQKVSPIGLRVGVIRDWESRWYADKDYADLLLEDVKIREFLFAECKNASVSRVEIERSKNRVEIMIRTARPGVIIGTNGENVEMLKKKVEKLTGGKNIYLKVLEIANPDLDAKLVARSIADQLEQRASFRTAQKKAIQRTMRAGAKGIKTAVSGVKVWICRGEVLPGQMVQEPEAPKNNMNDRRRNRRGNRGGNRNNSQRNNNNRNSAGGNAPRKAEGGK